MNRTHVVVVSQQRRSKEEGRAFVAPYDDPYTIAGQGTIGTEILRQCGDPAALHAIFVPIGGGGLIAGIAAYVKALRPDIKIIGVEPTGDQACRCGPRPHPEGWRFNKRVVGWVERRNHMDRLLSSCCWQGLEALSFGVNCVL